MKKNEFLCATKYDEGYFDFHCVPAGPPKTKAKWYTICGTPFGDRVEYAIVISTITAVAAGVFWNVYFNLCKGTKSLTVKKNKYQ